MRGIVQGWEKSVNDFHQNCEFFTYLTIIPHSSIISSVILFQLNDSEENGVTFYLKLS